MTPAELDNVDAMVKAASDPSRADREELQRWVAEHVAPALVAEVRRLSASPAVVMTFNVHAMQPSRVAAREIADVLQCALDRVQPPP
jgi:hypothetical protein